MNRFFLALSLLAPLAAAACTDASPSVDDEFLADDTVQIDDAKADLGSLSTYYQLDPDFRRCASPQCGGVYYHLLNSATTKCIDGKSAERCYASAVDWNRLGLNEAATAKASAGLFARQLIVRATAVKKNYPRVGSFAELRPTEAWVGHGPNVASGVFVKVELSGVRCITTPCPSFHEAKLNASTRANLAELDWSTSGATDEQIGAAQDDMLTNNLIIAGDRYTATGPAGRMAARTVTQFYQRVTDAKTCYIGGCAGQLCGDQPGVISTCIYRPEFACYASATCEAQADGNCGWTQTPELAACRASPPGL
jgi:hypothetical protein